jgi:hypothetical protein
MARSLPLAAGEAQPTTDTPDTVVTDDTAPTLTGSVAVFDPAMCCPTGLCGPGVDPALLTISRDLRWLERHGATVTRAGLSMEPQAFVDQAVVQGLLQTVGDGALPATLVNGQLLVHGRYPSREEIVQALTAPPA